MFLYEVLRLSHICVSMLVFMCRLCVLTTLSVHGHAYVSVYACVY